MKKFSKIIALLVLVVMIVGILVTNASAATSTPALKLTGISGVTSAGSNSFPHDGSTTSGMANDTGDKFPPSSLKYSVQTLFGNKYIRYNVSDTVSPGHTTTDDSGFTGWRVRDSKKNFFNNDFQVMDFEIMADKYITSYKLFFGEDYDLLEADEVGFARYKDTKEYYDGDASTAGIQKVYYSINQTLISSNYSKTATEGPFTEFSKEVTIGGTKYAKGDRYYEDGVAVNYNDIITRMPAVYIDAADAIHGTGANEGYLVKRSDPSVRYTIKGAKGQDIEVPLTEVDLSYNNGSYQQFCFGSTSGDNSQGSFSMYYIKGSDGNWYYTVNNSASTAKNGGAKLSNVAGEWNHVTIIFALDNSITYTIEGQDEPVVADFDEELIANIDVAKEIDTAYEHTDGKSYTDYSYNLKNSKVYFYMDGEYFGEKDILGGIKPATILANANLYEIRYRFKETQRFHVRFSVGHDNLALHYYEDGYDGPLAEFIAKDPTKPIYTLSDVLYSGAYDVPNEKPNAEVFAPFDAELPEDQKNEASLVSPLQAYDILYGIGTRVPEQGYLKVYESVYDVYPTNSFYVKAENGAEFELAPDSGYKKTAYPEMGDDWYLVTEVKDLIVVKWYADETYAKELYSLDKIQVGSEIVFGGEFSDDRMTYVGNNTYNRYVGWAYVVYDDNYQPVEYKKLEGTTVTQEVFDFAKDVGFGELSLVPYYGDVLATIEVVTPDGTRTPYFDASEFKKAVKTLTDGATLIISKDVTVTGSGTLISIPGYVTYNVDLNGAKLTQVDCGEDGIIFNLAVGATLNLYSSKVGGTIEQEGNSKAFNAAVNGTTINIGNPGDKSGDEAKVNIFTSRMIDVNGTHTYLTDAGDPENPITFNIWGLNFCSNKKLASYAVFGARTYMVINAKDSNFAVIGKPGSSNEARFLTTDGRFHTKLTATFDNCSIYTVNKAGTGVGFVSKELTRGSVVILKNCIVYGSTEISTGLVHGVTVGLDYYPPVAGETADEKAAREALNKENKNTSSTFFSPESKAPGYKNMASSYSASGNIYLEGNTVISGVTSIGSRVAISDNTAKIGIAEGAQEMTCEFVYYTEDGAQTVTKTVGYMTGYPEDISDEEFAVVTIEGKTEYWVPGGKIAEGKAESENIGGLYARKFTGWKKDGEVITNYVAGTYTLTGYEYVADIIGVKANLSANNGFIVNFYVPRTAAVSASVQGVAYDAKYNVFSVNAPVAGDGTVSITFTFEVPGYGEMEQTFSLSLLDYFNIILAGEDDKAKTLVVNAVNYCNELYKHANGENFEGYKAILDANADRIITAEDAQPVEVNAQEQTAFSDVQFIITDGNIPMFAFTKVGAGIVSIGYKSIYGYEQRIMCSVVTVGETEYYAVENMPVYEMIDEFDVYVNGEKVGSYSIANYVEVSENAIASALYGYGVAAKAWKTVPAEN